MSHGFSIRIKRDELTPDIRVKLRALKDPTPILRAIGTQLVSLTRRSFRDSSLRVAPWRPRSDGSASNLIGKGMLLSSIRITTTTKRNVTIGTDRRYAAIHQLGGVIRAKGKPLVFTIGGRTVFARKVTMPARPFFPFVPSGDIAPRAAAPVLHVAELAANRELRVT